MSFLANRCLAIAVVVLSLTSAAHAVVVTDATLLNTNQVRSETNNPPFPGPFSQTQQVAGLNLYYSTEGNAFAAGTLNGIGFHNLDLSTTTSGTGLVLTNAAPGVTLDYNIGCGADCPGSRNLATTIVGTDAAVANTLTAGNRYISTFGVGHTPNIVTFHGLTPSNDVYVQLIGGQHGWNGATSVFVNGDGVTPGTGVVETLDWLSDKTNITTAGLLGFFTTTKPSGDLTLELQTTFFSGISAFIIQQELVVPEPSSLALLGLGFCGLAVRTRRRWMAR